MNKIRTGLRAALLAAAVCEALFIMTGCTAADRTGGAEAARREATVSEGVLPTASAMKRRVLPNGMTVFLYPRRDATGSLEARLVVRAGSLQETEEERGIAHYVEHMAFNGTRDFPDQSAFKALEADGIMLGADVNAVTSLGGTTYRLSVPQATRTGLDTALHIMREWAFNITFRPEAFEREREIIVEEWRLREGVGARINGPLQTLRYEGSASRDRDPIGLIDVIRTAPVERAKAFYERWYSPQNMTLLLVGAFDEATADELIERYFASEPARGLETPADWGRFEPVANEDRLTTLVLDPEVSDRFVQIQLQRTLESTSDTVNEAWRETIERLTLDILGRRFALMKENGGQGSLQAPESSWILSPSETQVLLLARPGTDEPLEAALERASGALKTLAAFGPSKEELDAAVRARRDAVRSRRLAAVRRLRRRRRLPAADARRDAAGRNGLGLPRRGDGGPRQGLRLSAPCLPRQARRRCGRLREDVEGLASRRLDEGRRLARKALDRGEEDRVARSHAARRSRHGRNDGSAVAHGLGPRPSIRIRQRPEARDHRGSVAHGQDDPQPEACGRHVRGRSRPSRRARRTHAADEVRDRLSYGRRHPPCCKGRKGLGDELRRTAPPRHQGRGRP